MYIQFIFANPTTLLARDMMEQEEDLYEEKHPEMLGFLSWGHTHTHRLCTHSKSCTPWNWSRQQKDSLSKFGGTSSLVTFSVFHFKLLTQSPKKRDQSCTLKDFQIPDNAWSWPVKQQKAPSVSMRSSVFITVHTDRTTLNHKLWP